MEPPAIIVLVPAHQHVGQAALANLAEEESWMIKRKLSQGLTPVAPRMTILGLGKRNSLLSTPGGGPRPSEKPARLQKARKALRSHRSILSLICRTFQPGSPPPTTSGVKAMSTSSDHFQSDFFLGFFG